MACSGRRKIGDQFMKHSMMTAAIAGTLVWSAAGPFRLAAQPASSERLLQRQCRAWPTVIRTCRASGGAAAISEGVVLGDRPRGAPGAAPPQPPPTFSDFYQPSAAAHAKTLGDKDDPTLHCTPTAFGTLNVSLFDVGAVGQIVQTPKFVVMLTETYHGFQIIPFDGRPHRDNVPPSNRGDAVGRWDGDTFVVDKTNFTD